jgi:N-acetylmuramoyl-L-alanine amidase
MSDLDLAELMAETFQADSSIVAEVRPSPNHGDRKDDRHPDMILLHYTGMREANAALARLCAAASEVSAHYFVFEDGRVVQMVPESRRAWHAGRSSWAGETDINSCSIGIEIANPGHDYGYPDFPSRQIAAVTMLCRSILTRNTVPPERVLAHSDVAPARKRDPGEKFPWETLFHSGIGHWVEPAPIVANDVAIVLGDRGHGVTWLQENLAKYGYAVEVTGSYDGATQDVVAAFQRHFRPGRVDGICDESTRLTLRELLTKKGAANPAAAQARTFARLRS